VVADSVGSAPAAEVVEGVDDVLAFLTADLATHAVAEETALYPTVGDVLGSPAATETMIRDHAEIQAYAGELGLVRDIVVAEGLGNTAACEMRRLLYGLYALVRLHLAKEEEIYVPLLDEQLGQDEASRLVEAMEAAAAAAARVPRPQATA
jgi:iron-sulfur cluster repair protein YtfE (RIC family)